MSGWLLGRPVSDRLLEPPSDRRQLSSHLLEVSRWILCGWLTYSRLITGLVVWPLQRLDVWLVVLVG